MKTKSILAEKVPKSTVPKSTDSLESVEPTVLFDVVQKMESTVEPDYHSGNAPVVELELLFWKKFMSVVPKLKNRMKLFVVNYLWLFVWLNSNYLHEIRSLYLCFDILSTI